VAAHVAEESERRSDFKSGAHSLPRRTRNRRGSHGLSATRPTHRMS